MPAGWVGKGVWFWNGSDLGDLLDEADHDRVEPVVRPFRPLYGQRPSDASAQPTRPGEHPGDPVGVLKVEVCGNFVRLICTVEVLIVDGGQQLMERPGQRAE